MSISSQFSGVRGGILAAAALLVLAPDLAFAAGPFRPFLGSWRGTGAIQSSDGRSEPISCRATYTSDDEDTLSQALVCASDSFRINIQAEVSAQGGAVSGRWRETTRNVEGTLAGDVARGDFEGQVTGAGFTAQISLRAKGKKQAVRIQPSAGDIRSVEIVLSKSK